jgi:hypothetical protein
VVQFRDSFADCGVVTLPQARYYWHDLKAMVDGRGHHPSIIQFETFNEQDMAGGVYDDVNVSAAARWLRIYDPSRLIDVDSGGPGNALGYGDVNDWHANPDPHTYPNATATQYAMLGASSVGSGRVCTHQLHLSLSYSDTHTNTRAHRHTHTRTHTHTHTHTHTPPPPTHTHTHTYTRAQID